MPIYAIISHISLAIREPVVQKLSFVCILKSFRWFLNPVNKLRLLSPKILAVFDGPFVQFIAFFILK